MKRIKDNVIELCKMSDTGIHCFVRELIENNYKKYTITDQYIIAEGDIPVCLVAHLDTVFRTPPSDFFYDSEQKVLWSPDGLGTDDRAGVYAIAEILLKHKLKPHIIFTDGEEKGGIGASALIEDFPDCPFAELNFIIELDRQGHNDCVFYRCDNKPFARFIKKFGFEYALGTFTDISIIAPQWKVAAVNLSIGYYNEHTYTELLDVNSLKATISKVVKILKTEELQSYAYVPMKETINWWSRTRCIGCNKYVGNHGINVKDVMLSDYEFKLCKTCYEDFYGIDPASMGEADIQIEQNGEWVPATDLLV